jgi:hypothetical protein
MDLSDIIVVVIREEKAKEKTVVSRCVFTIRAMA